MTYDTAIELIRRLDQNRDLALAHRLTLNDEWEARELLERADAEDNGWRPPTQRRPT